MSKEDPPWIVLGLAAVAAEKRGEWQRATEFWGSAHNAWMRHCQTEDAKQDAKKRAWRRKRAMEDFEYERDLERGRGR